MPRLQSAAAAQGQGTNRSPHRWVCPALNLPPPQIRLRRRRSGPGMHTAALQSAQTLPASWPPPMAAYPHWRPAAPVRANCRLAVGIPKPAYGKSRGHRAATKTCRAALSWARRANFLEPDVLPPNWALAPRTPERGRRHSTSQISCVASAERTAARLRKECAMPAAVWSLRHVEPCAPEYFLVLDGQHAFAVRSWGRRASPGCAEPGTRF